MFRSIVFIVAITSSGYAVAGDPCIGKHVKQIMDSVNMYHLRRTNMDDSGWVKMWDGPEKISDSLIDIYRAVIPYGDVHIYVFDSNKIVTECSREYVSEEEYQQKKQQLAEKSDA